MTRLEKIIFDLDQFLIHLFFITNEEPTSLSLNFKKRRKKEFSMFHFSVVAFLVYNMKKKEILIIDIEEKVLEGSIIVKLDKLICGSKRSTTIESLSEKIARQYRGGRNDLATATVFEILDTPKRRDQKDIYTNTPEQTIWNALVKINEKNGKKIKLDIDDPKVNLKLDKIKLVYKDITDNDFAAWNGFFNDLKSNTDNIRAHVNNEVVDELRKYLKKLEKKMVINSFYIQLKVTLERNLKYSINKNITDIQDEEQLKSIYSFKGFYENKVESKSWVDIRDHYNKVILLAHPGMGKTALLQMEALDFAQNAINKINKGEVVEDLIIPIYINLNYLSKQEGFLIGGILNYLEEWFKTSESLIRIFNNKLRNGKCILLLDELENVEHKIRKQLWEKIEKFTEDNDCRIIITSRIVGYGGCPIAKFKEVEILPFSQQQINEFVNLWFKYKVNKVSAQYLINELNSNPQLDGFAKIPLFLFLMCKIYTTKNDTALPTRKVEILKEALNCILIEKPEFIKPQPIHRVHAKVELLEEIAYRFSDKNHHNFDYKELIAILSEIDIPQPLTDTAPGELIRELSEDDGILICLDKRKSLYASYTYIHRLFQEFLSANYIADVIKADTEAGLEAIRKKYLWDFEWHEIICMAAGLLKDPSPLIELISSEKDDIFAGMFILCGKCLVEIDMVIQNCFIHIIDELYEKWFSNELLEEYLTPIMVNLGRQNRHLLDKMISDYKIEDCNQYKLAGVLSKIGNNKAIETLVDSLNYEKDSHKDSAISSSREKVIHLLLQFL